ncbi:MAG: hypothetical protein V1847_00095 [Candidatus Diapherotrites archaeon]
MAEATKSVGDNFFDKLGDWFTTTIAIFAAAVFVLFGLGALYGAYVYTFDPFLLLAPFILAIVAYYSRNFALVFLLLILFSVLFWTGI